MAIIHRPKEPAAISRGYKWEAERADGSLFKKGAELDEAVRVSLIPDEGSGLPRHDLAGMVFKRRFCRVFQKTRFNRRLDLPGKIFWDNDSVIQKTTDDLRGLVQPGDFVGKGVAKELWYPVHEVRSDRLILLVPYRGKSKPQGMFGRMMKWSDMQPAGIYLHCIVCEGFRLWVNSSTGSAMITPEDQEVYL